MFRNILLVTLQILWIPLAFAKFAPVTVCGDELVRLHAGKLVLSTAALDLVIRAVADRGWDLKPKALAAREDEFRTLTRLLLDHEIGVEAFIKKAQFKYKSWTNAVAAVGGYKSDRTDWDEVDALGVLRDLAVDGPVHLRAVKVTREARTVELLRERGVRAGAAAFVDALLLRHGNDWTKVREAAGVPVEDELDVLARALRSLVKRFPNPNTTTLFWQSPEVERVTGLSGPVLYRMIRRNFGTMPPALEYAGIDTLLRPKPGDGKTWVKPSIRDILDFLRSQRVELREDKFWLDFENVKRLVKARFGLQTTAYAIWRAGTLEYGAWDVANGEVVVTDDGMVRALRAFARRFPLLRWQDFNDHSQAMRPTLLAELGREVSGATFYREIVSRFGSLIAALEYAGIDTLNMINRTPDLEEWDRPLVERWIRTLREAGVSLEPEDFLASPDASARVLGSGISGYSLWRAAIRLHGSWIAAVRAAGYEISAHHVSVAFKRLRLERLEYEDSERFWTPARLAQALTIAVEVDPALSQTSLLRHQGHITETIKARLGRTLSARSLLAYWSETFGSLVAALHFAGFEVRHLPYAGADLERWSEEAVDRGLRALVVAGVDLAPDSYFTNPTRIGAILSEVFGAEVSHYPFWKAAVATAGSWSRAVARVCPQCPVVGMNEKAHPALGSDNRRPIARNEEQVDVAPSLLGHALRALARHFPGLTAREIEQNSETVQNLLPTIMGHRMSGHAFFNSVVRTFGSWPAGLEYAGFDSRGVNNVREELRGADRIRMKAVLTELKAAGVDLSPEVFLLQHERVTQVVNVSALSVWVAALDAFGTWPAAMRAVGINYQGSCPAAWRERLILARRPQRSRAGRYPPEVITYALRTLASYYPSMRPYILGDKSTVIFRLLEKETGEGISGPVLMAEAEYHFGSWNAALEVAGFAVEGDDFSRYAPWGPDKLEQTFSFLEGRHVNLDPAKFFANHARVTKLMLDRFGAAVPPVVIARAARLRRRAWPIDPTHSAVRFEQRSLGKPGEWRRERDRWLAILDASAPSDPGLINVLRTYLDSHTTLEEWPAIMRFANDEGAETDGLPVLLENLEYQYTHLSHAAE